MPTENKVQFNLHNVHYAVLTETESSGVISYSYATPVAVPGAVTLTLDPAGDSTKFFADGIAYYASTTNSGYEGDLEIARVPDSMLADVWGFDLDATDKVLTESANVEPKYVALLYQIDGDQSGQHYVLYKCSLGRPGIGSTTNTETKEPQTASMSISAIPRPDYKIKAHTTKDTTSTIISGWYSSVYD